MARRKRTDDQPDPNAPTVVEVCAPPEPVLVNPFADEPAVVHAPAVLPAIAGLHSRADARLVAPRKPAPRLHNRAGLVIHCTGGERPDSPDDVPRILRAVQRYHMAPPKWVPALDESGRPKLKRDGSPRMRNVGGRGWGDGAYHWMVDPWGGAWQMRGWGVIGNHAKAGGHNLKSHGIAVFGNGSDITEPEKGAILWLAGDAERRFGPQFVRGHRDIPGVAKRCPGDAVLAFVRSLGRG